MNNKESISSFQLSMLFLAYITGSAVIIIPSPLAAAAGNGAWISELLALCSGVIVLACILYLYRHLPGPTYIEFSKQLFGKWLGWTIALPALLLLFLQLSNIVIDIGDFFKSTMMKQTPAPIFHFMFIILSALTARAGIEVMARMFVLLLFSMFGSIILVWIMVSPYYHLEYLFPIMPDGIGPILHGAYIANGFPYAEIGFFTMLLPYVRKKDDARYGKSLFWALLVNGITIVISVISAIMVTGPLAGFYKYTLYQLARLITFQEIVERVESVIGFSLIVGSYMKASLSLYILNAVVSRLFKVKDNRFLLFPLSIICFLLSNTLYTTELEFVEAVNVIWPLAINCLLILPLLVMTAIVMIKQSLK
ncbi:GerAB/ArcD/ProY family transporter [Paenibacillus wynnii]|uniref:GerAB/ArcD/ProY family transporter n=1 Tax=Paenibacillus wynnii TaxID=268407 RepID=UPI00278C98CD|nr:endospore germination permease [Paenibacillus wynnii]MDQ0194183.1 spore germination protein KB [Paenibacillus wynnii]